MQHWFAPQDSTQQRDHVSKLLTSFAERMIQRSENSLKIRIQAILNRDVEALARDSFDELKLLFSYQKQLLAAVDNVVATGGVDHVSSSAPAASNVLMSYTTLVLQSCVRVLKQLRQQTTMTVDQIEKGQVLSDSVMTTLLPYLLTAYPVHALSVRYVNEVFWFLCTSTARPITASLSHTHTHCLCFIVLLCLLYCWIW